MLKKVLLSLLLGSLILGLSCFNTDPLSGIVKLSRSNELEKKEEATVKYKLAIDTLVKAYANYAGLNKDIANRLMFNKQFLPAMQHLEAAKAIKSNDSEIYFWLGACYINLYKLKKDLNLLIQAEENYKIAMQLTPDYSELLYSYGQLLIYAKEDYSSGINILLKYLEIAKDNNPNTIKDPQGYFLLARAYYLNGDFDNAKMIYNIILRMEKLLTKAQKKALDDNLFILSGIK